MMRLALVGLVVAISLLAVAGMAHGWRTRARRQAHIPPPPPPPDGLAESAGVPGLYVATTTSGDWLDRVVAHGLGDRGRAEALLLPAGLLIRRTGASPVWIDSAAIRDVRLGQGLAQKVFEPGGVIVVTWQLGGALVDTGFRADDPGLHVELARQLAVRPGIGGGIR